MNPKPAEGKPSEFIIITKAKDFSFDVYEIATERHFPKKHRKLACDLMDSSREIVVHIQDANELDVADAGEFKERRYEQKKAISLCKDALWLIELAGKRNLISKATEYRLAQKCVEIKRMTASWRKKDRERFLQQQRGNAPRQ